MTATVAILVSMLVSFSLTPMMCSRLLQAAASRRQAGEAASRRGFYHWIEVAYMWLPAAVDAAPLGRAACW